jgi:NAD(P)-dependent dehydrogenase (short-subunit alcohol dehydrogenase family)
VRCGGPYGRGGTPETPLFEDDSDDEWARDLDVTLGGSYRCSCAALPHLVASGRGAIVNIGSVNGLQDFGNHANSAAKAGLGSLTRTLAGHAAARGVRVNLVVPGTVRTSAWQGREAELTEMQRLWSSTEASPRSTPAPHDGPSGPGASS